MKRSSEFNPTPAQKRLLEEKMEVLEKYAHADFDNLPKREHHPKAPRPKNDEIVQKKLDEANAMLKKMNLSFFENRAATKHKKD